MTSEKKTFASERPDESKQWNYKKNGTLTPDLVAPQANKKVWWTCEHGHEYERRIADRYLGGGCPYCAGKKVLAGFNDLASQYPDIASEWNYERNGDLTPDKVTSASGKNVWWVCEHGHEWEARIDGRTLRGTGCPYCSGRYAIAGENDLATTHPKIAAEWNDERNGELTPSEVKSASNKKVWWICEMEHEYEATVYHRAVRNQGCPYCANKKVLAGYNSLSDTHPELLDEWDYDKNDILPEEITAGSNKKVWWVCEKGHSHQTSINSKARGNGTKCPVCSGKIIIPGVNSLSTLYPNIAEEWDYEKNGDLTPEDVTAGSNKKVWWKCEHEHSYEAPVVNRTTTSQGCPTVQGIRY